MLDDSGLTPPRGAFFPYGYGQTVVPQTPTPTTCTTSSTRFFTPPLH